MITPTNYIELNDNKIILADATNPMVNRYPQMLLLSEDLYKKSWKFSFFIDKTNFNKEEYMFETKRYLFLKYEHYINVEDAGLKKYKVTIGYNRPGLFEKLLRFLKKGLK